MWQLYMFKGQLGGYLGVEPGKATFFGPNGTRYEHAKPKLAKLIEPLPTSKSMDPQKLETMVEAARCMAGDMEFVRVDFYEVFDGDKHSKSKKTRVLFQELTFVPEAAERFVPADLECAMGSLFHLETLDVYQNAPDSLPAPPWESSVFKPDRLFYLPHQLVHIYSTGIGSYTTSGTAEEAAMIAKCDQNIVTLIEPEESFGYTTATAAFMKHKRKKRPS